MGNKVILFGILGREPEKKYSQGGLAITNIVLSTGRQAKNPKTGAWEDVFDWHYVVAFDQIAENIAANAKEGSQIFIEGRLQTNQLVDEKTGATSIKIEVVAQKFEVGAINNSPHVAVPVNTKQHSPGQQSKPIPKQLTIPPQYGKSITVQEIDDLDSSYQKKKSIRTTGNGTKPRYTPAKKQPPTKGGQVAINADFDDDVPF